MPNVRAINQSKYNISKNRFRELYYFCLQYAEWKQELRFNTDTVSAITSDGQPHSSSISDSTGRLAIKRAELKTKCKAIEDAVKEADQECAKWLLQGVTTGCSYNYLKYKLNMPCGRDRYYDRRREFYWRLDKKI